MKTCAMEHSGTPYGTTTPRLRMRQSTCFASVTKVAGLGTLDPELLRLASRSRRIIVSSDVSTLITEHNNLVLSGQWTPGLIIVRKNININEIVEYLALVCHTTSEYEWECNCKFIPL